MNKINKFLSIFLIIIVLMTTGCSKRQIDKESGQAYIENIFCKPTSSELVETYEKNGIDITELPNCSEFNLTTGGYEGLWTSFIVKPLSYIILKLGNLVRSYGLAVILISIVIRALMLPMTIKTAMQSENMKKVKPKLDKLEKKYAGKTDEQSVMMKSQEMMLIYKENHINPFGSCLFALLQLPIFMGFIEAIYRVPLFFESEFLTLKLGTTTSQALSAGHYQYLIVVVLIVGATIISFKNMNASMDQQQQSQMKVMLYMMLGMIAIASFQLPVAIGIYWVTSSIFTLIQNIIVKKKFGTNNN